MSEEETINTLQLIKQAVTKVDFEDKTKTQITRAIETILDLYQQKCKQNKDAKDYIEYYLLDNMSIEGNGENTHKELKKLYNMLGGDNLR